MRRNEPRREKPTSVGVDEDRLKRAVQVLKDGIAEGAAPGAVVCAFRRGKLFLEEAVGTKDGKAAATPETVYDLASITKPLATASSLLTLVEQGRIHLLTPLPALFGDAAKPWGDVTVGHLLTHTSGLPAWTACYKTGEGLDNAVKAILSLPDEKAAKPGTKYEYSCLGFILLGRIIENTTGQSLDRFARDNVFLRLGLETLQYRPPQSLYARVAPTVAAEGPEGTPGTPTELPLCGIVHDGNARGIGGVSGNAGLFGTAREVASFGNALLHPEGDARLFGAPTLARIFANQVRPGVGGHSLMFFAEGNGLNPSGDLLSDRAVGHSGFTGTVLTIDPEFDLAVAVLTNSVFSSGGKTKWLPLRRRFLNALAAALE